MNTRREFTASVFAGLAAPLASRAAMIDDKAGGVTIGAVTYSFRTEPRGPHGDSIDVVLRDLKECQVGITELFSPQIEQVASMPPFPRPAPGSPPPSRQEMMARMRAYRDSPEAKKAREDLRNWRLNTPVSYFESVHKKFNETGVRIFAYTMNYADDFTGAEIDKTFEEAQGLGAKIIATSTRVSMAERLKAPAEKHKILVAFHGHDQTSNPNEFSTPETFSKALALSSMFRINLDIGHFTAAGYDPVAFIEQNHAKITHLHIKDRKKNHGPNESFGEGETPIREVLLLLKKNKYPLPALIEYEYQGAGTPVEEVTKSMNYMRKILA